LKELIQEEKARREKQNEEQYKMYNAVQGMIHNMEGEMMKKLKEHRVEQLGMFTNGEEERQRLERMKVERTDSDTQYVKQMVGTLERRLEEEQEYRLRNEQDTRKYFEAKLEAVHEKLKHEEKTALEREKRLMH